MKYLKEGENKKDRLSLIFDPIEYFKGGLSAGAAKYISVKGPWWQGISNEGKMKFGLQLQLLPEPSRSKDVVQHDSLMSMPEIFANCAREIPYVDSLGFTDFCMAVEIWSDSEQYIVSTVKIPEEDFVREMKYYEEAKAHFEGKDERED